MRAGVPAPTGRGTARALDAADPSGAADAAVAVRSAGVLTPTDAAVDMAALSSVRTGGSEVSRNASFSAEGVAHARTRVAATTTIRRTFCS